MPYGVVAQFGRRTVRGSSRRLYIRSAVLYLCGEFIPSDLFARAIDDRGRVVYDYVRAHAAVHRDKLFRFIEFYEYLRDSLFAMDDGEIAVGRKARDGSFFLFHVPFDTFPARLFVSAENKAQALCRLIALLEKLYSRVHTAYHRTFVVQHSSAVYPAVLYFAERIRVPLAFVRHGIDVSENAEQVSLSDLCKDVITVAVTSLKAVIFRGLFNKTQTLCDTFAERTVRAGRALYAVHRKKFHRSFQSLIEKIHFSPLKSFHIYNIPKS